MQDLLAKDRQGCRPRAACERKEPPQEEEEAGCAEGRGSGNGGRRWDPATVELVVIDTEAAVDAAAAALLPSHLMSDGPVCP